MKCPFCEKDFSDTVYPLHLNRCSAKPKEEIKAEAAEAEFESLPELSDEEISEVTPLAEKESKPVNKKGRR